MRCRSRIPLQSLRRSPGSTGVIQSRAKSLRFCIWPSPRRDSFVRPRAVSAGACAATCDARFISKANIDGLEYPLNSRGCQTSENTDHTPRSAPARLRRCGGAVQHRRSPRPAESGALWCPKCVYMFRTCVRVPAPTCTGFQSVVRNLGQAAVTSQFRIPSQIPSQALPHTHRSVIVRTQLGANLQDPCVTAPTAS